MYAVIKTGGKQYRAAAGDKIQIEKLEGSAGDTVAFGEVLMIVNGDQVEVGTPFIGGATVAGEIASHDRGPKIIIFKKRRRKHYRRKNGHRQDLTSVTITEILTNGAMPVMKKAEVAAAMEAAPEPAPEPAPMAAVQPVAAQIEAAPAKLAETAAPAAAAVADDISLIGGIGPKNHKILTDMGITTFAQIAAWGADDIDRVEAEIKMKGRVAREEWVEQAQELMAGKPPRSKTDKART